MRRSAGARRHRPQEAPTSPLPPSPSRLKLAACSLPSVAAHSMHEALEALGEMLQPA
jgi:hypothetical protein